jgi:hydrogenase maturation protease
VSAALSILGIGSPFGDDRAGWSAAALLAANPFVTCSAGQIEVRTLDRPGSLLLAEFGQSNAVILIDAVCSGALPGTILRLEADTVSAAHSLLSSHGLGVAQAVGLARQLGGLPAQFVFFGLEVEHGFTGRGLSPAVTAALPRLVEQIIQQAEVWMELTPAVSGGAFR